MRVPDLHLPFESERRCRFVEALGRVIQEAVELGIEIADLTDMEDADLIAESKRLFPLVQAARRPFQPVPAFEGPIDEQLCTVCQSGRPRNRCRCALR